MLEVESSFEDDDDVLQPSRCFDHLKNVGMGELE